MSLSEDVSDFSVDGEAFEIAEALVPNKITVIDFWADWCGPCHVLTEKLEKLAQQHRDLAVRRVEVPNFDTPVAKRYLQGIKGLPIIWIYGKDGKRIQKLEAITPDQGIEAVKKVLLAQ